MSEAARRLAEELWKREEFSKSDEKFVAQAFEWLLVKIRERRDEIRETYRRGLLHGRVEFWSLFDDGAEFGPDKKGPTNAKPIEEIIELRRKIADYSELLQEALSNLPPNFIIARRIKSFLEKN